LLIVELPLQRGMQRLVEIVGVEITAKSFPHFCPPGELCQEK
jgi:hypothetical protein